MKISSTRFLAYLQIQFQMVFMRWRWLLPIPVMVVIGYMMINYLQQYQLPDFLSQTQSTPVVNVWDALFISFGNAHYMTFVIANLFLILICDMLPEPTFAQLSLFRLRSRSAWWISKILVMFSAAFGYTILCAIVIVGTAAFKLPISFAWSSGTYGYPANVLLPNFVVDQMSLPATVGTLLLLVTLGFWTLGLLTQVITMITQKFLYGYFGSLLVLVGSYALCGSIVNSPDWIKLLPVQHNLCLTMFPYPVRDLPLGWSYLYWVVFLGIMFVAGYITSKRQDYISQQH